MSDSTKSEFTCCSSSFARALVVGPILISLDLSCAISSLIENDNGVYVGVESEFYQLLEDKQTLLNYDIREEQRLWNDYQIILKYLD